MAIYRYPQFLLRVDHTLFETPYPTGSPTPYSGIYRCRVCGQETVVKRDETLPPTDHHPHFLGDEEMYWQLTAVPPE